MKRGCNLWHLALAALMALKTIKDLIIMSLVPQMPASQVYYLNLEEMKEIYQKELILFIAPLMEAEAVTPEFVQYQSIISMVYSLIEDGRQQELDKVLRVFFSEYYTDRNIFIHLSELTVKPN